MTLSARISSVLQQLGLQRQTLAQRLKTSPATITRLLARPDDEQTIGQLQAVAEALDLRWHHSLHNPAEHQEALLAAGTATAAAAPGVFPAARALSVTLAEAAERQLQRSMRSLHDPQRFELPLAHERNGDTVEVVGWALGQLPISREDSTMVEAYWVVYTSHKNWLSLSGITCNVLFYDPAGYAQTDWVDHAVSRVQLRLPTDAGRAYLRLRPATAATALSPDVTLVCERSSGSEGSVSLVLNARDRHHDLFESLTRALDTLPEVIERGQLVPVPLAVRIEQVQRGAGVPVAWREHDLYTCGIATQAGLSDEENLQTIEDASVDSLRNFATRYRLRPEWVQHGVTPAAHGSTLRSLGWYGHEIVHELARHRHDLEAVHVVMSGHDVQLAWQRRHPAVPGVSVYDYVTPLDWSFSPQRVSLKAVLQFVLHAEIPVIGVQLPQGLRREVFEGRLMYSEYLRHPSGTSLNVPAMLAQHDGFDEVEDSGHPQPRNVTYFYDSFGSQKALAQLRSTEDED